MVNRAARHVYGPVASRRFGRSLGVDVVPHKVCCYDCTYCQVGQTTDLTVERRLFFDPGELAREVETALIAGPAAEVVTLAGSGEPTLYAGLEELVVELRQVTRLPLALLTNGGLLWHDDVARAAMAFDLVAPSLDAADAETFVSINRPAPEITFARMLEGLRAFSRSFRGLCRLEVLLVRGLNDSPESLAGLSRLASTLRVDAVDVNTVVRPAPSAQVVGLDEGAMRLALGYFECCKASIVAPRRRLGGATEVAGQRFCAGPAAEDAGAEAVRLRILATVARRPSTLADLAVCLCVPAEDVERLCEREVERGRLLVETRGGQLYYRLRVSSKELEGPR